LIFKKLNKSNNLKKIILNPENIEINTDGVKNFFWPVKFNEVNNFKNVLLKKLILNLKNEIDKKYLLKKK